MKIAVIAANGKAGRLIVEEAANRGMDVTAIVRGENRTVAPTAIVKDLFDLTAEDLAGYDAVVCAYGTWTPEAIDLIPAATAHLADVLAGSEARLLVVGGAGSLYVDPDHTKTVVDVTQFPDEAMPVVNGHGKALEALRTRDDVRWTYVIPPGTSSPTARRRSLPNPPPTTCSASSWPRSCRP
jgi:putative NADH-flavin reductase